MGPFWENRKAVIREEKIYVVDLFEDDKLVERRELPGKSIHYAQDVAENWETGIIPTPEKTEPWRFNEDELHL